MFKPFVSVVAAIALSANSAAASPDGFGQFGINIGAHTYCWLSKPVLSQAVLSVKAQSCIEEAVREDRLLDVLKAYKAHGTPQQLASITELVRHLVIAGRALVVNEVETAKLREQGQYPSSMGRY